MQEDRKPDRRAQTDKEREVQEHLRERNPPQKLVTRHPDKMVRGPGYQTK